MAATDLPLEPLGQLPVGGDEGLLGFDLGDNMLLNIYRRYGDFDTTYNFAVEIVDHPTCRSTLELCVDVFRAKNVI